MIALLCSVPAEAELLTGKIEIRQSLMLGSKTLIEGEIAGQKVCLCVGGIGKANAAHAATLLIIRHQPRVFVIFGIGGAYPGAGIRVGDIAIATREIAGDDGVLTREGFRDTEFIGIPLVSTGAATLYNEFPASDPVLARSLKALGSGQRVHTGTFVTLSTCTGTAERAADLEKRHRAVCENMEGAAAAQVALAHNVPWLELRGISNIVQDRDLKAWNIPRAAEAAQNAVLNIVAGWGKW